MAIKQLKKTKYIMHEIEEFFTARTDTVWRDEIFGMYTISFVTENYQPFEYIRMTTRKIKDRLNVHKSDLRLYYSATVFFYILPKQNIKIYFNNARIIFPIKL